MCFVKVGEPKEGESAGEPEQHQLLGAGHGRVLLLHCSPTEQTPERAQLHKYRQEEQPEKMQRNVAQIKNSKPWPALLCSNFPASQPSAGINTPEKRVPGVTKHTGCTWEQNLVWGIYLPSQMWFRPQTYGVSQNDASRMCHSSPCKRKRRAEAAGAGAEGGSICAQTQSSWEFTA